MLTSETDLHNLRNRLAASQSNGDYNARNFVDVPAHVLERILTDLATLAKLEKS